MALDAKASAEAGDAMDCSPSAVPMQTDDELDGAPPDATDNANYFCEYAYLYHQMDMLEDRHRTGSYFTAIMSNPESFRDKVVLDVGAGSGILSIFAARAGARQVFAVEATDMAQKARRIVEANGLSEVVRVIQGTIETVALPCKVDVIVSEWMGYLLLRESMLDSVLFARDKFLQPDGALFPSHATLCLGPVSGLQLLQDKQRQWEGEISRWNTFTEDMKSAYETDFTVLEEDYMHEHRRYHLQTGAFVNLTPNRICGRGHPLLQLDLRTCQLSELKAPQEAQTCTMRMTKDCLLEGFCGYFDVAFRGCPARPAEQEITLTTAPSNVTSTHWGQQVFGFYPAMAVKRGDALECKVKLMRQEPNHRLLRLECHFVLVSGAGKDRVVKEERDETYFVD